MHLSLLLAFLFFSLALGSPSDVLYIKKLVADESQLLDAKNYAGLVNIYTKNVTYNAGEPQNEYGVSSVQARLAVLLPTDLITQLAINTESITLLPPFDEQGAAGAATGVVYITATYIGQGNLSGQSATFLGYYGDKYIKTGDFARHGGWRIRERLFFELGSRAIGNLDVIPRSERT